MTEIRNLRAGDTPPTAPEPIAIIGMGVRFPGASDVESFWRLLADGRETVGEYVPGRFPYIDDVYAAHSEFAERIASRRGGFLEGLDQFDAEFFGISPREAALLDPQQRLLLEVAWEAVEDAGLPRERLVAGRTGVFVGVWTSDYEDCLNEASPQVGFHGTTGSGRYATSGRLAYAFDLRGPNLTIDTACSSSLVAIHLACQSLRAGESSVALAGGVNVILRPEITLAYSDAGMLAPDGRCKFGDASANGYVRSEGAGILVLKRLSDAIADHDSIYAVIRGSAVNNNGQSSGQLVAPSRTGQEDVIRSALEYARVDAADVAYVEAHGTGTFVGDPIEIESIGRVVASAKRTAPCAIGSIKTNIGHTESAAGVAGVMKVALALNRGVIPPSLHFRAPNPRIPWADLSVSVATQAMAWPRTSSGSALPIAGVTGIGITGTNAHAVLQAIAPAVAPAAITSDRPLLFALSGQTPDALRAVAASWVARLNADASWPSSLADLAYTSTVRRTHHDERLVVAAASRVELTERLGTWLAGESLAGVVSGRRLPGAHDRVVFVYPGQGGQWLGMGRTLLEREPVFRDALRRCDDAIAKQVGWRVIDELRAPSEASRLDEIDVVQPTLFALMVALTELLRSFGVEPSAVVGHSMGEVAAAAVAGALSLDDAAAVICHRSRLMKRLRGRGAMAIVELGLEETQALVAGVEGVSIAASNAARSTVISGDVAAVESLLDLLEAREIFCRRIKVDVASHSTHMNAVRGELEAALVGIAPRAGHLPIYSTTTGEIEDGSRLDALYWGQNLRQPVLFHQAVERLFADGFEAFVEINAHPVLTHSLTESADDARHRAVVTGTLRRDSDEIVEVLSAVGRLHAAGFPVGWERLYPSGISLRLPTYPWRRERHWFDAPAYARALSATARAVGASAEPRRIDPAECVTEIGWVDAPTSEPGPASVRREGRWIVFDADGTGSAIAANLGPCTIVRPADAFRVVDADTIEIDPASDDDLRRALAGRLAGCAGIVHAWAASSPSSEELELDALWAAQTLGTFAVARLARVLAELAASAPVRLWVVTRGMHKASGADAVPFPAHGALAGLQRAIAREHPELSCTHLDLSAVPTETDCKTAAAAMLAGVDDQQTLIRGARRLVARRRRTNALAAASVPSIRSDATYLVTGGLGGIARHVVRWLVARGARSLVLTGRSAPRGEAAECIADLEAQGATIRIVLGDLADRDDVGRLIAAATADARPLRGVFHLAAVVDDTLLVHASEESYRRVMRPKMAGGWNLYRGLAAAPLDFWISFSSIATVVTQPGQGPYAAANAFLDGLARYASARGTRMQSLQWGPWADTGLAHEDGTQRSFRAYAEEGIAPFAPDAGISILEYAMTRDAPVALTASVDWPTFLATPSEQAIAAEFQELGPSTRSESAQPTTTPAESSLRDRLVALPADAQSALLETHLRDELAVVLRTSASRIDPRKPMGSMGVDSLLALEFVRRLSRSTGVKLPATSVFNYPTVTALAQNILSRMSLPVAPLVDAPQAQPVARPADSVPSDLAAMSDDDALRALVSEPRAPR